MLAGGGGDVCFRNEQGRNGEVYAKIETEIQFIIDEK